MTSFPSTRSISSLASALFCGLLAVSCGVSDSDTTNTGSGLDDTATTVAEFIPKSFFWAIAEAGWDGESLTSFFRSADDSSAVEPYIDFRLLMLDFLQQVSSDNSCSWVSKLGVGLGETLQDPVEDIITDDWVFIYVPLELSQIETDCDFDGFSGVDESFGSLKLTLSLGPILQHVEVEVVQMLQTLGYDGEYAGRMFGARLGWKTSEGEEIWRDLGWGVSRRLDQGGGNYLLLDPEGDVELQQMTDGKIPSGALAIYGLYEIELADLFR